MTAQTDPLPLDYLTAHGTRADAILPLTWGVLSIAVVVVLVISGLLIWALFRRRAPVQMHDPVARSGKGVQWIVWGVGLSTLVLFGTVVWTMQTLAAVVHPAEEPALRVAVDARQWWWRVEYLSETPSDRVVTANELRIPVGKTVEIDLTTSDVIHSFWVPALTGKTDMIPGRTNRTWIEASRAGVFRGQCQEYCGVEHARMGFTVVAMEPDAFQDWYLQQTRPAEEPSDPAALSGRQTFMARCSQCHAVRGTPAGGSAGPDLTHVASRLTIAAGTLPMERDDLAYWIEHPQDVKPGNFMADMPLTDQELDRLTDYLLTLE